MFSGVPGVGSGMGFDGLPFGRFLGCLGGVASSFSLTGSRGL